MSTPFTRANRYNSRTRKCADCGETLLRREGKRCASCAPKEEARLVALFGPACEDCGVRSKNGCEACYLRRENEAERTAEAYGAARLNGLSVSDALDEAREAGARAWD